MTTHSTTDKTDDMASFDKDYKREMDTHYGGDTEKGSFAAPNDDTGDDNKAAARMDDDSSPDDTSPTDDILQQVRKDFDDIFGKVQSSFETLFGEFESFYAVSTQALTAFGQVQMSEQAESQRLDQVEPEINGFTAQFGDYAQDEAVGAAMADDSSH